MLSMGTFTRARGGTRMFLVLAATFDNASVTGRHGKRAEVKYIQIPFLYRHQNFLRLSLLIEFDQK